MATIIRDVCTMQQTADSCRLSGARVCVVPTMGALHEGHLALIRAGRTHADVVITTVFVNPTQFGAGEDFGRYPRNLDRDAELASGAGTDVVFAPGTAEMYVTDHRTYVETELLSGVLEGKSRPGHFRGVTTVVAKLFNVTKPHVAVFGQKDAQQVIVVRRMIRDLNFDVEVVVVPTVREPDGLAMSSRNVYLTAEQRAQAPVLYQTLQAAHRMIAGGDRAPSAIRADMQELISARTSAAIDYVSIADAETLEELSLVTPGREVLVSLAARFGSTRLIDNILVTP